MEYLRCTWHCLLVLFLFNAVRLDLTTSSRTRMRDDAGPTMRFSGEERRERRPAGEADSGRVLSC